MRLHRSCEEAKRLKNLLLLFIKRNRNIVQKYPREAAASAAAVITLLLALYLFHEKPDASLYLRESSFEHLPGWKGDAVKEAVAPLQKSCDALLKKAPTAEIGTDGFAGKAELWQAACRKLSERPPKTDEEARKFFEDNFIPYAAYGENGAKGLFTGYYEPTLHGSRTKHGRYRTPLYSLPTDLVSANLGDFKASLKGESIVGRVEGNRFVPYYTRGEIEGGALGKKGKVLAWVDSAVDAFFLHIQGSGRIVMGKGKTLRVGYAGENGHSYVAIGRELLRQGALEKGNVSMQSIRAWLEAHPDEADDIMNVNASYIFFRKLETKDGPIGAQGVSLTPKRSMAVDRKKIPYGLPLWLDAAEPENKGRLQRMMIAQDTGGAITGAVRGDFFWGAEEGAAHKAGLMKSEGRFWLLLPKGVVIPSEKKKKFLWVF